MRYLNCIGLRLRVEGDWERAERSMGLAFAAGGRRPCDLVVRFHARDLPPVRLDGQIPGLGFNLDPRRRRLDYLLTRSRDCAVRRRAFFEAVAFAWSTIQERRRSFPRRHLLFLHASGVLGPRGVLVFCGYSTYGKSTIARLLREAGPCIGDDCVVLRCEQACGEASRNGRTGRSRFRALFLGRYAEGAEPWRPVSEARWALPIAGVFWLTKGRLYSLAPMAPARALLSILPPIGQTPQEAANKARWVKRFVQRYPCRQLEFAKDRRALVRFLRQEGYL